MIKEKIDFLIIDGDSFIHRAYHGYKAHNKGTSSDKNFAIKGFTEMLTRVINKYDSTFLAVVLDHKGITFRKEIYPDYKGNRPPKEQNFLIQVDAIHDFVKASGLPSFCVEGVEGDDVIGVLAVKAQSLNWKTTVLSGDKDMAQIVDSNTKILDTKTNKEIRLDNLEEHFGVKHPHQIIEFLALQGDKADNILGMVDCGTKTAQKIIEKYNTINNLIESDLDELLEYIKPIIRNKKKAANIVRQVRDEGDTLLFWKFLTSLKLDIELNLTMKDIKVSEERIDFDVINKIQSEYGLNLNYSLPQKSKKHISIS